MPESSREEIAKLEALYANNPEGRVFTHLAEAYRKAGELDRARSILEQGLTRHAGYASAHVVLGRVLMDQQNTAEAGDAFRRVLNLDPHNLVALRSLGELARSAGRSTEALGYFEELRHQDPNNEEIAAIIEELKQAPAAPVEETPVEETAAPGASQPEEPMPESAPEVESAPVAEAEPLEHETFGNLDLGWSPAEEEAEEIGLPGDLGSLTGFGAETEAPAEAETPILPTFSDPAAELPPLEELPPLDELPQLEELQPLEELPAFEELPPLESELSSVEEISEAEELPPLAGLPPLEEEEQAPATTSQEEPVFEQPAFEETVQDAAVEGEVVTETIAELYTAQGLHDRAASVYRTLLQQRPDDSTLAARLRESEDAARAGALEQEQREEAEPWIAGGAVAAASVPTPYAWSEAAGDAEADSGAPISSYFARLLSWRPAGPAPTDEARVVIAAEPPAVEEPAAPSAFEEPLIEKSNEFVPPEPGEFLLDEPVAAENFYDVPLPEPEPEPAPITQTAVAPEAPPAPPTGPAPTGDLMPWEEPAPPAPEAQAAPEFTPPPATAGSEAKTADAAFDEWFGPSEPTPPAPPAATSAPETGAAQGEGEAESDDDDLEMFRSWLQSLKK